MSGALDPSVNRCETCGGTGKGIKVYPGTGVARGSCGHCGGTGLVPAPAPSIDPASWSTPLRELLEAGTQGEREAEWCGKHSGYHIRTEEAGGFMLAEEGRDIDIPQEQSWANAILAVTAPDLSREALLLAEAAERWRDERDRNAEAVPFGDAQPVFDAEDALVAALESFKALVAAIPQVVKQ